MYTACIPHARTHLDELVKVDTARRIFLHGELALLEIEGELGREPAQVLGHLYICMGSACWGAHGMHTPYYICMCME